MHPVCEKDSRIGSGGWSIDIPGMDHNNAPQTYSNLTYNLTCKTPGKIFPGPSWLMEGSHHGSERIAVKLGTHRNQ